MKGAWLVTAAFGALLVACSTLFEDAVQCKTDGDCARFENAICGAAGTCETKFEPGSDTVRPGDLPDGGVGPLPDGAVVSPDGAPAVVCPVLELRPEKPFPGTVDGGAGELLADATLDCQSTYALTGVVVVRSVLTIQPGTWIKASTDAALVIAPGGKLNAVGTSDLPVVFTSAKTANPTPQDWLGIGVLGKAPPEGTLNGEAYGGATPDDSSGSLRFVRIEYAVRGLDMRSVGSGTVVDGVMVRRSQDNCFTVEGGRVNLKRLVCQYPGDEMFEITNGYEGRAQFLVGQRTPLQGGGHHGILLDNSTLTLANATLCGAEANNGGMGLLLRNNAAPSFQNLIVRGFGAGMDVSAGRGTPFELKASVFQGNHTENVAYEEGGSADMASPLFDDDAAFDERAFFADGARKNSETDPGMAGCYDPAAPTFTPATQVAGEPSPADPFFEAAPYAGAVSDPAADWTKGAWLKWGTN